MKFSQTRKKSQVPEQLEKETNPKPKLSEIRQKSESKESFPPGLLDVRLENYTLPGPELLDPHDEEERQPLDRQELLDIQALIVDTLAQFGISAKPGTRMIAKRKGAVPMVRADAKSAISRSLIKWNSSRKKWYLKILVATPCS